MEVAYLNTSIENKQIIITGLSSELALASFQKYADKNFIYGTYNNNKVNIHIVSSLRHSILLKSHSEVTFNLVFKDLFKVIELRLFSDHNSVINELSAHFSSFRVVFFFVSHDTEDSWHTLGFF